MKYDVITYIGRMGPPHIGHIKTVVRASELARNIVVLLGCSDEPRTPKNPFTFEERKQMLEISLDNDVLKKLTILPLHDFKYNNNAWKLQVQTLVDGAASSLVPDKPNPSIAMIGHSKDDSSWYLGTFPQWAFVNMPLVTIAGSRYFDQMLSATTVREHLFELGVVPDAVTPNVKAWLSEWMKSDAYKYVKAEHDFLTEFKATWANSPYPPTFNTVDAVVTQSGHILMIQRKNPPQVGTWALPGGYLDENETMQCSMIRELREETKIRVPSKILNACITKRKTFDDPKRSERGRVITQAFHISLSDTSTGLPRVRGADDAVNAEWIPINKFLTMREVIFEDHYHLVRSLLGI